MPKLVIYLRDQDQNALEELAEQEYRVPKAQAALIIRRELERRGLVEPDSTISAEDRSDHHEAALIA